MKPWLRLTDEERRSAVVTLRDSGMSKARIAEELRVAAETLRAFIDRHQIDGLIKRRPTDGWYALSDAEKTQSIRELDERGLVTAEIAEELGITLGAVRWVAEKHGIRLSHSRICIAVDGPPMVPDIPVDPLVWLPIHGAPVNIERNTGCSWPIDTPDGQKCCGAPKHKRSYCKEHFAMAHKNKGGGDE